LGDNLILDAQKLEKYTNNTLTNHLTKHKLISIDFNKCQSCINQWKAINPIAKMLPPPRDTNEKALPSVLMSALTVLTD
jgi:hypothetical protein